DDAGLLEGDRFDCLTEILLVIQANRGNGSDHGRDHIRRVEASAQSDFEHRYLDARAAEELERNGGGCLEKCWRRVQRTGRYKRVCAVQHEGCRRLERGGIDGCSSD